MEKSEKEKLEKSKELVPADLELAKQVDPTKYPNWQGCSVSEVSISFECPKCKKKYDLKPNLFSSQSDGKPRGLLSTGRSITFDSSVLGKLSTVVAVIVALVIGSFIASLFGSPPFVYAIIAVLLFPVLKPIFAYLFSRVGTGKQMSVWFFKCMSCGNRLLIATDMSEAYITDMQANVDK